jgi:hypothetical protein
MSAAVGTDFDSEHLPASRYRSAKASQAPLWDVQNQEYLRPKQHLQRTFRSWSHRRSHQQNVTNISILADADGSRQIRK